MGPDIIVRSTGHFHALLAESPQSIRENGGFPDVPAKLFETHAAELGRAGPGRERGRDPGEVRSMPPALFTLLQVVADQTPVRGCVRSHLGSIRRIIWAQAAMAMNVSDVCTRYS